MVVKCTWRSQRALQMLNTQHTHWAATSRWINLWSGLCGLNIQVWHISFVLLSTRNPPGWAGCLTVLHWVHDPRDGVPHRAWCSAALSASDRPPLRCSNQCSHLKEADSRDRGPIIAGMTWLTGEMREGLCLTKKVERTPPAHWRANEQRTFILNIQGGRFSLSGSSRVWQGFQFVAHK